MKTKNKKTSRILITIPLRVFFIDLYRLHSEYSEYSEHSESRKLEKLTRKNPELKVRNEKMEALNVIREAIESLSAEEKIDDGKYLELMNHMKTVYGSMPQPRPEADGVPRPIVRERIAEPPMLITDEVRQRYFLIPYNEHNVMWGQRWYETRDYTPDGFAQTFDELMKANGDYGLGLYNLFERYFTVSNIGNTFYNFIMRDENKVGWIDADMRERFFSLPIIRNKNIEYALIRKKAMVDCLLVIKDTTNPEDWAKLLWRMGFHFMNGFRHTNRNNGETKPRTEAELKKLHLLRVSWRMNATQNMEVELYTDKIQLGRTQCVQAMYRMALIYALLFPEFNAPIERFRYRMMGQRVSQYPVMSMSGITAHTRNKNRTYIQKDGDFTITYISKLNDVDA